MPKREQTLSPIGDVIVAERKALGIRVVDFCHEAHISRVTYYELLKGNNTPSRYTADSCAACRRGMIASVATAEPLGSQRSHHTQHRNHASSSSDFSTRYWSERVSVDDAAIKLLHCYKRQTSVTMKKYFACIIRHRMYTKAVSIGGHHLSCVL